MSVLDLMRRRYSLRSFADRPIDRDTLLRVLEAARIAPSACNNQPWHFLVVQDPAARATLATCYARDWVKAAPVILVCCAETAKAWCRTSDSKNHADVDLAIAIDHITLAATEVGLGTCWVCAFDTVRARTVLQLPAGIDPIALIPIGYPASDATPAQMHGKRKSLDEIVHWEQF